MDLVFVHGWGSGPFVWKEMIDAFGEYNVHQVSLGFVGDEKIELPEGKFIGIGHSLGGAWLLKHYPERLSGFVSVASFNCFYKHIPAQILASMQKNIVKDTAKQLSDFWSHAGLNQPGGFKNINPLQLLEGLKWLSTWNPDIPDGLPIKVLASHNDHIVPPKMTENVWQNHNIDWIKEGGHMLPLTQAEWCVQNIKEFIHGIE